MPDAPDVAALAARPDLYCRALDHIPTDGPCGVCIPCQFAAVLRTQVAEIVRLERERDEAREEAGIVRRYVIEAHEAHFGYHFPWEALDADA